MAFWTWTSLWILPVMRPYRDDISGYWSTGIRALKSHPDLKLEETDQQKPIGRIRLLLLASSCHIYCHFFFLPTIMSHNNVTDLLPIITGCLGLVACLNTWNTYMTCWPMWWKGANNWNSGFSPLSSKRNCHHPTGKCQVVSWIKRIMNCEKTGHSGTLDPKAREKIWRFWGVSCRRQESK